MDELEQLVTSYRTLIQWYIKCHGELTSVGLIEDQNPRFKDDLMWKEAAPIILETEKTKWLIKREEERKQNPLGYVVFERSLNLSDAPGRKTNKKKKK